VGITEGGNKIDRRMSAKEEVHAEGALDASLSTHLMFIFSAGESMWSLRSRLSKFCIRRMIAPTSLVLFLYHVIES
jgi:hypothetical protein